MSGIDYLRRRFRDLTIYRCRSRARQRFTPCLRSTVLPSLQADVFDALELGPEETSATLPAPREAANAVRMEWAAAARQERDTPRSLVLTTATATFGSPTVGQTSAPSAIDRHKRDEAARGAAGGAMLAQARLPPKAAETDLASASSFSARPPASTSLLSLLEGRRGPSAGAGQPAASNSLDNFKCVGLILIPLNTDVLN